MGADIIVKCFCFKKIWTLFSSFYLSPFNSDFRLRDNERFRSKVGASLTGWTPGEFVYRKLLQILMYHKFLGFLAQTDFLTTDILTTHLLTTDILPTDFLTTDFLTAILKTEFSDNRFSDNWISDKCFSKFWGLDFFYNFFYNLFDNF